MNTSALIGFIFGGTCIVYLVRMLFLFLFKKFLGAEENRKSKNLSLIFAAIFCTLLYYLASNEFLGSYILGAIVIFLLGLIPNKKGLAK